MSRSKEYPVCSDITKSFFLSLEKKPKVYISSIKILNRIVKILHFFERIYITKTAVLTN